jgi:hypothetical protein
VPPLAEVISSEQIMRQGVSSVSRICLRRSASVSRLSNTDTPRRTGCSLVPRTRKRLAARDEGASTVPLLPPTTSRCCCAARSMLSNGLRTPGLSTDFKAMVRPLVKLAPKARSGRPSFAIPRSEASVT